MRVTLSNFGGLIPRRSDHNLPALAAIEAHDVKLRNGRLESWHEPALFGRAVDNAHSFYILKCCLLSWTTDVQVAELGVDHKAAYLTGRTDDLEAVILDDCQPTYFALSMTAPPAAPHVTGEPYCGRDYDVRAYVYTYVNALGDESPPSPPSNIVTVKDGSAVTVSGIALPDPKYGVKEINIYRAATGLRHVDGSGAQKHETDFLYVTTIPATSSEFVDSIPLLGLGPVLDTALSTMRCPPVGMRNLVSIDGFERLAATKGNTIYLCETEQVINWPVENEIMLDSTICHMGQMNQQLYVTTATTPYIIKVACDSTMPVVKDLGYKLPDIGRGYNCNTVMTPLGFVYSSWMGLVLITPDGGYRIITAPWFGEDEWRELAPDTVRLAFWEGYLFCTTDEISFMLNINGGTYEDMPLGELVTISDRPIDMRVTNTGQLAMLRRSDHAEDGLSWHEWDVSIWDNGDALRPFRWVSRELIGGSNAPAANMPSSAPSLGCMWSPASAKVRTAGTQFTLLTPVPGHPGYTRFVADERPFRLPRIGRHMWYRVAFEGVGAVEFADLGTAHFTVNEGV